MAELRYGPNGESLIPGTAAYNAGSPVKPTSGTTSGTTGTTGLPTLQPRLNPIILPGVKDPVNIEEAKAWFKFIKNTGNKDQYNTFVSALAARGIPKSKAQAVWNDAVEWTQMIGGYTTPYPEDYLDYLDPTDYVEAPKIKYGTSKQVTTQATEYSTSAAAQQISDTMEKELGRTATQAEIDAYTAAVNAEAAKAPSTYTGFTTTSPGVKGAELGVSTSKGTQTTGFDPTMFARNFARSQPDYAESFAAKNVLGIIEGLLSDRTAIGKVVQ